MAVRSSAATKRQSGALLALTSTPEGRTRIVAQAARVAWPAGLHGAAARAAGEGDSAWVEVAFDGVAGRTYTFTQITAFADEGKDPRAAVSSEAETAHARGWQTQDTRHPNANGYAFGWQ